MGKASVCSLENTWSWQMYILLKKSAYPNLRNWNETQQELIPNGNQNRTCGIRNGNQNMSCGFT